MSLELSTRSKLFNNALLCSQQPKNIYHHHVDVVFFFFFFFFFCVRVKKSQKNGLAFLFHELHLNRQLAWVVLSRSLKLLSSHIENSFDKLLQ